MMRVENVRWIGCLPRRLKIFVEMMQAKRHRLDPAAIEGVLDQRHEFVQTKAGDRLLPANPDPGLVLRLKGRMQVPQIARRLVPINPPGGRQPG